MLRLHASWPLALILGAAASCVYGQESRPVATIDGEPITQGELVRYLVDQNREIVTNTLVLEAVLDIELKKAGITLTDEEKAKSGWMRLGESEGKTLDTRPWGSVGDGIVNKQLFIRRKLDHYEIARWDAETRPAAGLVATIRAKTEHASRSIPSEQAWALALRLVNVDAMRKAVEDVIDGRVIDRELRKSGKSVNPDEVDAWARSMQAKYPPPFDWRMICQFKNTTMDQEREHWRRTQAWKRVSGWQLEEKELRSFFEANRDRFSGSYRSVSEERKTLDDRDYRSWIVDELETGKLKAWIADLRAKSTIWIAPDAELATVKELR